MGGKNSRRSIAHLSQQSNPPFKDIPKTATTKKEKQEEEDTGYWTYCGFSCSSIKEKQQQIIDELLDFNKYNPEYSMIMMAKLMEMLYESRNQMIRMKQSS